MAEEIKTEFTLAHDDVVTARQLLGKTLEIEGQRAVIGNVDLYSLRSYATMGEATDHWISLSLDPVGGKEKDRYWLVIGQFGDNIFVTSDERFPDSVDVDAARSGYVEVEALGDAKQAVSLQDGKNISRGSLLVTRPDGRGTIHSLERFESGTYNFKAWQFPRWAIFLVQEPK
ncbi:MAG TPA: hypothetical protein VHB73_00360 [Alphaproteobacteria bacterium]|nr:hypothetical protein [Alphaproteobacteria bacterium]